VILQADGLLIKPGRCISTLSRRMLKRADVQVVVVEQMRVGGSYI
jgi:hypothetical protein